MKNFNFFSCFSFVPGLDRCVLLPQQFRMHWRKMLNNSKRRPVSDWFRCVPRSWVEWCEKQKLHSNCQLDSPSDFHFSRKRTNWGYVAAGFAGRVRKGRHNELGESICVRIGKLFHYIPFIQFVAAMYSVVRRVLKMVYCMLLASFLLNLLTCKHTTVV